MLLRSYSRLNETIFDIYLDRDRLPWHFKVFATLSTWLALAGYVLFAIVFTSREDNLQAQPTILTTLAGVGLLTGYLGVILTGILSRSLLFTFDGILLPALTTSVMGIFITAMNQGLHKSFDISTQAYIYVPLITACVTTLITTVLSTMAYYKLTAIKEMDAKRRAHIPVDHQFYKVNSHGQPQLPGPPVPLEYIPDDEAQRRQLLRLLLAKDGHNLALEEASNTYKIDLPWDGALTRARSGSVPVSGKKGFWTLGNLMPGRGRSDTTDSFKDPRERRREEIERSTMLSPKHSGASSGGGLPTPVTSPGWGGQSTRYA